MPCRGITGGWAIAHSVFLLNSNAALGVEACRNTTCPPKIIFDLKSFHLRDNNFFQNCCHFQYNIRCYIENDHNFERNYYRANQRTLGQK